MQYKITVAYMIKNSSHLFKLHNLSLINQKCIHYHALHFCNEIKQSSEFYNNCCESEKIVLLTVWFIFFYFSKLMITDYFNVKHFQNWINEYNNAIMFIFCIFNKNEYFNYSEDDIQSFIIHDELYHMHESLQHVFNQIFSFI